MAPMLFYCRVFGYKGVIARFIFSFRMWLDPVTWGSYVADKSHCQAHCCAWLQPGMLAAAQCPIVWASLSAQQLSFLLNMSSQGLCISASERSRKGYLCNPHVHMHWNNCTPEDALECSSHQFGPLHLLSQLGATQCSAMKRSNKVRSKTGRKKAV